MNLSIMCISRGARGGGGGGDECGRWDGRTNGYQKGTKRTYTIELILAADRERRIQLASHH